MEATHSPTADATKARTRSETIDEKSPRHVGDSPASPSSTPSSPPSSTPSLALCPSIAGTTGLGRILPLPSAPFPLATHPTSPALTPAAQPASTGAATGSTVSTGTASDEKRMCVHTCCAANPHVTLFAQRGGQQNHNASLHAHPCPPCDDSCPGRAFVVQVVRWGLAVAAVQGAMRVIVSVPAVVADEIVDGDVSNRDELQRECDDGGQAIALACSGPLVPPLATPENMAVKLHTRHEI